MEVRDFGPGAIKKGLETVLVVTTEETQQAYNEQRPEILENSYKAKTAP